MHIDVLQGCELLNRLPFVFGKRTLEQGRPSVISCTFGDLPTSVERSSKFTPDRNWLTGSSDYSSTPAISRFLVS